MLEKFELGKSNRRNYLINPRFQIGLTSVFFVLALCNVGALFFGYRFLVSSLFKQFTLLDEKSGLVMTEMLVRQSGLIERSLIFFVIFVLAYHIAIGVIMFHHIAGPAYALRKQLQRLNQGENPPPLRLRKHDFMVDVVEELNAYALKVHKDQEK